MDTRTMDTPNKTANGDFAHDGWALARFGIGQPVPRTEDPVLVQGQGRYTDDLDLPGQAYAVVVRSNHAHGLIRGIDTGTARAMPGVLGIYTAADLAGYGSLPCMVSFRNRDGSEMKKPPRPALAADKVRFVGDPVALVVAETLLQAKNAAEAVVLDIAPLPAVTRASEAAAHGAPQLFDTVANNIALDYHYGDSEKIAAAFAQAAHVTKLSIRNTRIVCAPLETRAAIAAYDAASGRWTLHCPSQGVFGLKSQLVNTLKTTPDKLRVLTGHVGGSFGVKAAIYPEHVVLLHAARALGRAVKWTDERSGSFVSDHHGRDHEVTAELALDKSGRFLAVRLTLPSASKRMPPISLFGGAVTSR